MGGGGEGGITKLALWKQLEVRHSGAGQIGCAGGEKVKQQWWLYIGSGIEVFRNSTIYKRSEGTEQLV